MKKDRDWLDYALLTSNLAQNLQLRQTNKAIKGLELAVAERALREEKRRDEDRQLDQLREWVSQIADDIINIQERLSENPCAALALGLQIKGLLEKNKITTASFREWQDKDRLKNARKGLESVCERSSALLTDERREDAVRCAAYLAERDALDQLIGLQRRKESFDCGRQELEKQLAAQKGDLLKLKEEQVSIRLPFWQRFCTVVGGLGLAFSIAWLLGFFMIQPLDTGDFAALKPAAVGPPLSVPGWVTSVVFVSSLILGGMALMASQRLRQRELAKRAESLEIEIATLHAELDRYDRNSPIVCQQSLELELGLPDFQRKAEQIEIERGEFSQSRATQQRWDELTALFGAGRSAKELGGMKRDREAFILTVFGKTE